MTRVTTIARFVCHRAQMAAAFALCIGASLVLPITLAAVGFQAL